jgi:hypothetical protein
MSSQSVFSEPVILLPALFLSGWIASAHKIILAKVIPTIPAYHGAQSMLMAQIVTAGAQALLIGCLFISLYGLQLKVDGEVASNFFVKWLGFIACLAFCLYFVAYHN